MTGDNHFEANSHASLSFEQQRVQKTLCLCWYGVDSMRRENFPGESPGVLPEDLRNSYFALRERIDSVLISLESGSSLPDDETLKDIRDRSILLSEGMKTYAKNKNTTGSLDSSAAD